MKAGQKLALWTLFACVWGAFHSAQAGAQDDAKGSLPETGQAGAEEPGTPPQVPAAAPQARGACLPLTARELFEAGELNPYSPSYPVSRRFGFTPTQEGEEILAVRKFECEGARSFVLFTKGTYRRQEPDGTIAFQRSQNLSVVSNFNASGDAWNFAVSSASRDEADTWCLPKKEFCSKKVDRRAHGLKDEAQAEILVKAEDAYSLRHGEDLVLQAAVTRLCGKPPEPRKVCLAWVNGETLCMPMGFDQASALFPQIKEDPAANCPTAEQPAGAADLQQPVEGVEPEGTAKQ